MGWWSERSDEGPPWYFYYVHSLLFEGHAYTFLAPGRVARTQDDVIRSWLLNSISHSHNTKNLGTYTMNTEHIPFLTLSLKDSWDGEARG